MKLIFTKELQKVYKIYKSSLVEVNICKKLQEIYKSYKKFQEIKLNLKLMFPKDHNRFEADIYLNVQKLLPKLQQVDSSKLAINPNYLFAIS